MTSRLARLGVDVLEHARRVVVPLQPGGVVDHPRQRPDGRLDGRVGRHRAAAGGVAGQVGHPEQLGDALTTEEGRDQRLVGLLADGREHVGDLLAAGVERRDVDRDDAVDVAVVDRRVERVLEVLGGRVGARARWRW